MSNREELVINKVIGQDGLERVFPVSSTTALIRTSAGTTTLATAAGIDRRVILMATIITTFAAGDGAAPIFSVGQTSALTKFVNALTTGTAGAKVMYDGTLTAGTELLITSTAATGTTSTGAVTFTAMVV